MKRSRFRVLMDALLRTMRRQVRNAVVQQGVPVTLEQRERLASAMLPAIRRARAQSHTLGAQMLETQAQALEIPTPPVQSVRRYERQAVVTMLEDVTLVSDRSSNATVTVDDPGEVAERRPRVSVTVVDPESRRSSRVSVELTEDNRRDPEVVKVIADKVQAVAERHARMPSREALTDAVESDDDDDGPKIGWARVLTGAESCGFCAMLASRGPVYKSKKSASDAGGVDGKAYHDNCDCEVVLVREDQDWVGREEYEALEQLWASSTAGTNGKTALKAFTAALNQEIVDGTAGRFIADPDRELEDDI
ncbi:hypothetical protein RQN9TF_11140 [Rhodococcus qingshengii]|uniref:VG15 protein n=1 Tax=Rhodococcus qingshengii TaxID=334542 RepID=UPI0022044B19|nr:hypothetical protein [Rhodococcus qingshengii]BDQ19756.1 hypothetical protein RQN9TF_11140 [Rhodococcus qingshengii]